jgi:hypothetical protein
MNRFLQIESDDRLPAVALRSIGAGDIDELRLWKNASREWFFHKEEISPAAQKAWFEGYLRRDRDFLFAVEAGGRRAGFMGFRLVDETADIYAFIARPETGGRETLGRALKLLISCIKAEHSARIVSKLVFGDPALASFLEQGFRVAAKTEGYDTLELDASRFQPMPYRKSAPQ